MSGQSDKKGLSIMNVLVLAVALLAGLGCVALWTQVSALQGQVSGLQSENARLRESFEQLNRTLIQALTNRTPGSGGLVLRFKTKSSVRRGETVSVKVNLTNHGAQNVTLTFPTSKQFDLQVIDSTGRQVYRWSSDKVFITIITQIKLQPSESKVQMLTWTCDLPTGDYTLIVLLEAYEATLSHSEPLRVEQ